MKQSFKTGKKALKDKFLEQIKTKHRAYIDP